MELYIDSYSIFRNYLELYFTNGLSKKINFNENSGKVYFRFKLDYPSIKHPGVFVGIDENDEEIWIHNHRDIGTASATTGQGFKVGQPIYIYKEYCLNSPIVVIQKAMEHVMNGERYLPYSYNCQTLVNDSCNNKRESEDADRIVKSSLVGLAALLAIGLIISD